MTNSKKNVFIIDLLKGFFKNKFNSWILIFSFVLSAGTYFYFVANQQKIVIPSDNELEIECYTDIANGGNSEILSQGATDSTFEVTFKLNDQFNFPYVGISLLNKKDSVFNISRYDRMLLEVSGEEVKGLGVSLFANDSVAGKFKYVCYYENFTINQERKVYTINFSELEIPDWWYDGSNIPLGKKIEPNLRSVYRINIGIANSTASEDKRVLKLYSISFEKDNRNLIKILFLGEILLILLLAAIHYKKHKKAAAVTIIYKAVDVEEENQKANNYLNYINNHFQDSELTLEKVSDETGINQRRITSLIQKNFKCNFKTYLNRLRINESKRLLLDSDLNKGEIAYKVGFKNQTNFNRVFKTLEGITPSQFLEENKK